jgi:hypothetical protein
VVTVTVRRGTTPLEPVTSVLHDYRQDAPHASGEVEQ